MDTELSFVYIYCSHVILGYALTKANKLIGAFTTPAAL